jgi:potassium-transporting ATPase KdpC subunit
MWTQIWTALRFNILLTILAGVIYPLVITGICQIAFPHKANGSLILQDRKVIGSELLGQNFARAEYFHPRPSAAGSAGYDAASSSGSNLGPTSAKLIRGTIKVDDKNNEVVDFEGINLRIVHYCLENGIPYQSSMPLEQFKDASGNLDDVKLIKAFNDDRAPLIFSAKEPIPADAVTGSASGLDPHISPANATMQAARVAKIRGVSPDHVKRLIAQFTEAPTFGIVGELRVNVLRLNMALDQHFRPWERRRLAGSWLRMPAIYESKEPVADWVVIGER